MPCRGALLQVDMEAHGGPCVEDSNLSNEAFFSSMLKPGAGQFSPLGKATWFGHVFLFCNSARLCEQDLTLNDG